MNRDLIYLQEPKLRFGFGQSAEDPRDGLALFGPYESFASYSIQAGVIGTRKGIELYREFVSTINKPIYSSSVQRPTFPGFQSVFNIDWPTTPAVAREIDEDSLKRLLAIEGLQERSYRVVSLYLDEIRKVHAQEETKVDIWFILVPPELWQNCRPQSADKPHLDIDAIREVRAGQTVMFQEMREEYKEQSEIIDFDSDFHDQLKARLLKEKLLIPVQIMLEPTLQFKDKYRNWDYKPEMRAHLAWTQSATVYYKLGKLPWKLDAVRAGVCYVGLVFKKYSVGLSKGYACSAAQMFLDSGDGTVFRGNIGPWKSKSSKDFHLDQPSSKELLSKALESYRGRMGQYPRELFIHGRAHFAREEWLGFEEAVQRTDPGIQLVGVVIRESDKLKLFRDVEGEDSKFGNLRGLAWIEDDREAFLWTRGFVPRLNSSTSLEIPNPLRIRIDKSDADIIQVVNDISALTKLNYNACLYGDGVPVTLRFSDLIGNILTAVDQIEIEVLPFKYYI